MSRIGKKPVEIPEKVKLQLVGSGLKIEGPLGKKELDIHPAIGVDIQDKQVVFEDKEQSKDTKSLHGLFRSLVSNAVQGVSKGFERVLEINGVGYRADVKGQDLNLSLGFSHPVKLTIPKDVQAKVDKQTKIILSGPDKEVLGQLAAQIRSVRPVEPYKGKGVRYEGEEVIRKQGKTGAGGK